MSSPRPLEFDYLAPAELALIQSMGGEVSNFELRLQMLEAVSSRFGGFDLAAFHKTFGIKSLKPTNELLLLAAPIAAAIESSPIHFALALSALSREVLQEQDRKVTGAYHTDFRLAMRLAQAASINLTYESKVIDPACGAGILLAALTNKVCGMDRAKVSYWLANGVCAADLSLNSLRATLLSLASYTDDLEALKLMRSRWFCGDSLLASSSVWKGMSQDGFDAVIGNPPWEKVKLSKHEFLKSSGAQRFYGEQIESIDLEEFASRRGKVADYSLKLQARYPSLSDGEADLYIAFTELFFELCKVHGIVTAIVPGGLIRSQGTESIRQRIFESSRSVQISIIDNRAKFFSIDTRFKFLIIAVVKAGPGKCKREPIQLLHERGTPTGLECFGQASIGRGSLAVIRKDLSIPEVKSLTEWTLFSKIAQNGIAWDESGWGWTPSFCREVDMTKDRPKFFMKQTAGTLPLIEGRMVQAHRLGVKGYISGSGRSAKWEAYQVGLSRLTPQFWIDPVNVSKSSLNRVNSLRVGFCDIAGQTNERSLMATLIPAGVVCGNKVPTIQFPEDLSEDRLLVWLAIANSFVFDWMLRRILTTTVNYFLLQSIPLPRLTKDGLPWQRLRNLVRELIKLDKQGASKIIHRRAAQLRAEIDAEVAISYGIGVKDMETVFQDFTLLDRGQAILPNEKKSTITRDMVLSVLARRTGVCEHSWFDRVENAVNLGACAYVPSEFVQGAETSEGNGVNCYE
jgi:Alw26I/Eco31I/Esp3I family type II restriction m6 adenine DNA methyltransferase